MEIWKNLDFLGFKNKFVRGLDLSFGIFLFSLWGIIWYGFVVCLSLELI